MDKINWGILFDYLTQSINAIKDFAVVEIPDIIKQLLIYEMIGQMVWLVLFLLGFVLALIVFYILFKNATNEKTIHDTKVILFSLLPIPLIAGSIFLGVAVPKLITCSQIYFTPKAYLIHYVKDIYTLKEKAGN